MPDSYLRENRAELTNLVNDAIRETFRLYFDIDVNIDKVFSFKPIRDAVICRTEIDDNNSNAAILISIEKEMLIELAAKIYGEAAAKEQASYESCAMEITNIVCSRIKTFFNDHGHNFGMHLPHIVTNIEDHSNDLELLFSVREDKMTVDIGMHDKSKIVSSS